MIVHCGRCGAKCDVTLSDFVVSKFEELGRPFPYLCSHCFELQNAEDEAKQAQTEIDEEEFLDESVIKAGVRPGYAVRKPYVPYVAEWLLRHREGSVLLSGETGTGKSTSAGYFVREMLRDGFTAGVYYFSELVDKWREVRCDHDNPYAIKDFFRAIESDDYIVIDECAGKTVNTDSSREFMFRFLEDINSRTCTAHVFLLGNFYKGSIADIFGDEAPSMRRIRENFTLGLIDKRNQTIKNFN